MPPRCVLSIGTSVPSLLLSLLLCNSNFHWFPCSCFVAIILPYSPPHQFAPLLFGTFYVIQGKKGLWIHSLDFMQRHVWYVTFFNPCVYHFLVALAQALHINFWTWFPSCQYYELLALDGLEEECRNPLQDLIHLLVVQKKLKWWKKYGKVTFSFFGCIVV